LRPTFLSEMQSGRNFLEMNMARLWPVVAALLISCATAKAGNLVLAVGRNATAFHMDVCGRRFDTKEPFEDHWWRYIDVLVALNRKTGQKFDVPTIREADNFSNACALIGPDGKRYVVVDPGLWSQNDGAIEELIIYGHELGHQVCGHTITAFRGSPWEKELEADRFAGAGLRALHDDTQMTDYRGIYEAITLDTATAAARSLFGKFVASDTHPGAEQRVAAIREGYLNGSPCSSRVMVNVPDSGSPPAGLTNSNVNLWDHNGSMVRLSADGAIRKFYYESPHAGLESVGIRKGTLLFTGIRSANSYSGTAYVFSRCGPKPYQVSGPVSDDQRQVTLYGKVPVTDANCKIASWRDDTLVFTFTGN
jgi:hypothetical protein